MVLALKLMGAEEAGYAETLKEGSYRGQDQECGEKSTSRSDVPEVGCRSFSGRFGA